MKNFSWLRRDRAPVAVLTMLLLVACSDTNHEPTSPPAQRSLTPLRFPTADYSAQDGSQITVYHAQGGWARLDVAAQTLTDNQGTVLPLTADQTIAFLNDFQATVVYDNIANAVQGLPSCEQCIEPTSADGVPLGSSAGSSASNPWTFQVAEVRTVKPKPSDKFGTVVTDLDKSLKELAKEARKSRSATILEWPPNCAIALTQIRAATDSYLAYRHSVGDGLLTLFRTAAGVAWPGLGGKVAAQMPELAERFVMKDLAQHSLSLMQAMYTGLCGNSIPIGTFGYGWYPGAIQECIVSREWFSYDGVHYAWATVYMCKYRAVQ